MKKIGTILTLIFALCLALIGQVNAATTILPQGYTCFQSSAGPIAGGSVYFYYPNTSIFKQTWQDSTQATLNPQPVLLDSNGCALIYGVGSYREVVYSGADNTSPLVWDAITTDTSAYNSVFWAGLASGTPNVITIVDTGFNATDGSVIQFVALSTNTGATTLNPSGFAAIPVVKDTTAGPVSLSGGEIVAGNIISVVYYSTTNSFHLLNAVIASASGATAPLCGASQLSITNDAGTPNTLVDITASQALTQTTAGLVLNRSSVNVTVNTASGTSTSTAGGMDGESVGTNQWIYLWLIDNGSAISALGSTSSTAPTMPSGYTYKCRVGAMPVDGSGVLFRTLQQGKLTQYKIVNGSNTTKIPVIANGVDGTYSSTSPTLSAITVATNTFSANLNCAPATATAVIIDAYSKWKAGSQSNVLVAPSTAWGGTNAGPQGTQGLIWPIALTSTQGSQAILELEHNTIAWASDAAGGALGCQGYIDAVNTN